MSLTGWNIGDEAAHKGGKTPNFGVEQAEKDSVRGDGSRNEDVRLERIEVTKMGRECFSFRHQRGRAVQGVCLLSRNISPKGRQNATAISIKPGKTWTLAEKPDDDEWGTREDACTGVFRPPHIDAGRHTRWSPPHVGGLRRRLPTDRLDLGRLWALGRQPLADWGRCVP
ncbi:hypothetical protein BCR34DRAFT_63322 [Clohesyomyces aquaticus]|uniref:Uncharacterized protein n=1 Tax=Clohesyomyces aquaticus TaxID=1231657 RepID=A0A1Y1Z138_9PLEO|nr:hypothetical protein BCR34DRAFT_63322 [Clohesyomyces aquaticus]